MVEQVARKIVWPLLGIGLVVVGIALIWDRGVANGAIWYVALIVMGLAMISLEHTERIVVVMGALFRGMVPGKSGDGGEASRAKDEKIENLVQQNLEVFGADKAPPATDEWYRVLRPVLHQASYYTVPTYYLTSDIHIVGWNIAFEIIFGDVLSKLCDKHVNYFIALLENSEESFSHARDFTEKVYKGGLPWVDIEPLVYRSTRYGRVTFAKVATQLHDADGQPRGWAVALLIREIDWVSFLKDLKARLDQEKLWSVYSSSYDRVLLEFPPYHKLLEEVTAVIPEGSLSVADLGAGTGNVTKMLLKAGHRVNAVESNMAMLDRLRSKNLETSHLKVTFASVDRLYSLREGAFNAAVMVNVLYAVDDPLACLREIHRILKPGGVLGFSTTHTGSNVPYLLAQIQAHLKKIGKDKELADDFERIREVNEYIDKTIARRHSAEDYCQWVRTAGFEITRQVDSTYEGAVMLVHARKVG